MRVDGATTILMDLNPRNAQKFLLEPAVRFDNVLNSSSGLNVYEVMPGVKHKVRMLHLTDPANSLQPKTNCKTWNPTVSQYLEPDEIDTTSFELMGEQCPDEFDVGCVRNFQGAGNEINNLNATGELNAMEMAMLMTLRRGINKDTYKIAWFGDSKFNDSGYDYDVDLNMKASEVTKFNNMMRARNGFWSEMRARVAAGMMKSIDTNDGTAGGNATNPANIKDFLKDMKKRAAPELKFWNLDRPRSEWPVFLLQYGLYQAYHDYISSLGNSIPDAYLFFQNGEPVPGVLAYDGHPVVMVPEWTLFDKEIGNISTTTDISKYQRAVFTAQRNMTIATDVEDITGRPGSGLVIEQSTRVIDKGIKWLYMAMRLGFGIAHDKLCVAGWNSSTTYA
jgi:hypothetical protein